MKENKGKEVADEVVKQGVQSQPRPPASEKQKNISSRVGLGDLPSRHGREKKHKSAKPQDVKSTPPVSNQGSPIQILNLDSEPKDPLSKKVSSIVHAPTSSLHSKEVPQHLFGNEDLGWERFTMAVTNGCVCLLQYVFRDFEHSGVHDLFKVSLIFFLIYIYIYIHLVFSQQCRHIFNKILISVGNVQVHCCAQASN